MFIQNEEVFKVFKTLLSLNSDYLINKIESTNKIKSNKEYNSVPESTGIYKYYVASYNPNINNGNIEISEFYYQYKK